MKFIISSEYFLKKLQVIEGAVPTGNTKPILSNFLLQLHNNELKITAASEDNTIIAVLEVEGEGTATVAVPASLLLKTIKTFPSQPLTFLLENKTNLQITASQGKYDMPCFDGDEYPPEPAVEDAITTTINPLVFNKAINSTFFATATPELSQLMSGVYMEYNTDRFRCSATDSHKLVRYERTDVTSSQNISFVIPKKTINLLKGILYKDEEELTIVYNQKNAKFIFNGITLISRLIVGEYPNFDNVIPTQNPNVLTVDRKLFLNSVKRIAIFSNETNHSMKLAITGQQLLISAEDFDYSKSGSESMPCSYEGDDMEIGFNSRFLSEMLSNLESDHVSIEMSLPNRPGILFPIDSNEHESIVMLVMPIVLG